jgi:hypothetical protein
MRDSIAPDDWVARPDQDRTYGMGGLAVHENDLDAVTAALQQAGWLDKEEAT